MEPVVGGWYLRIVVIICRFGNMGGVSRRGIMATGFPQAQMTQYLSDDLLIIDKGDNPNFTLTLWTYQRIDLVDFLYQSCPVLPPLFGWHFILQDKGDVVIGFRLLPKAPGFVAVISIVTHRLFISSWDMRYKEGQPVQCIKVCRVLPSFEV